MVAGCDSSTFRIWRSSWMKIWAEDLVRRFDKLTTTKARMVEAIDGAHMMAIATFSMRGNYAEIREIAVMPVTADWIPEGFVSAGDGGRQRCSLRTPAVAEGKLRHAIPVLT
ncbi:MAG: hypothetical protein COB97_00135 [Paracoccus sp.]|nr:MAG: hypothetical protein COB97_00135 [Paracoccus sp. (in: a-proteobacteria)]